MLGLYRARFADGELDALIVTTALSTIRVDLGGLDRGTRVIAMTSIALVAEPGYASLPAKGFAGLL